MVSSPFFSIVPQVSNYQWVGDTRSNPGFMWRTGPTYRGVRAGGGLAKSWSPRLRINGKPCNLGLGLGGSVGRYPIVTLADACDKAFENARAARSRKRAARPLACPYVQASRYRDKKRRQREAQAGAAAQGRPGPQASGAGRGERREQRELASGAGDAGRAVLNWVRCFVASQRDAR